MKSSRKIQKCDVVVVGAGLAGLSAAKTIQASNDSLKIVVLEANDKIGGRLKQLEGLAPWPIEIGAEFLHGDHLSSIKRLADKMGCKQRELPYPDHYYFENTKQLLCREEAEKNPDLLHLHRIFEGLEDEELDSYKQDISVMQYLRSKGASDSVISFAESIYANDFGCSLSKLGLKECIHEAKNWIYGNSYFILDRPLAAVVDFLASGIQVEVNRQVTLVEYGSGGVKIGDKNGGLVFAHQVILTVPLTVLKAGDIEFRPPLPAEKQKAIASIGMSNAIKVVLTFSHRFWPKELFDIVCSESFLPEIWMTEYPSHPQEKSFQNGRPPLGSQRLSGQRVSHLAKGDKKEANADEGDPVTPLGSFSCVGFAAGDRAQEIMELPLEEIVRRSIAQLDDIFGVHGSQKARGTIFPEFKPSYSWGEGSTILPSAKSPSNVNPSQFPASAFFAGAHIVDWSKVAHVKGAYTYPTIGAHGERNVLSHPLQGSVFFAGEASHPGVNPCMQAALDTGERAAFEVLARRLGSKL